MSVYDSYDLFQTLGHGATCTVKRAVRKDSQQVFAAKLYQADFLAAKNQMQMLIRLDHPNIVNIYEVFEQDQCIILILEYMQGGQLYDYMGQKQYLQQEVVRQKRGYKGIARVIQKLYENHHRRHKVLSLDECYPSGYQSKKGVIQPQNLLLSSNTPEGLLKLADFGISKIMSDQMLTTNCGTPVYMAPEIWKGLQYNKKVDLWSLGIVMYYLLSGDHPFNGDADSIGDKIIQQQVKFQGPSWSKISSKAIDLLRKLLQKDPQKRISAVQATTHIWFSYIEPIYSFMSDESYQQSTKVKLTHAIHKIKRYNMRRKGQKKLKKLKSLLMIDNLASSHKNFLITQSTSPSTQESQQAALLLGGYKNSMATVEEMEIEYTEI